MNRTQDGVLQLGPDDVGLTLEHDDYERANYAPGFRYELVAGRLAVTPMPNMPHYQVQQFLLRALLRYSSDHPEVVAEVGTSTRLITRALGAISDVEPDLAVYRDFPRGRGARWQDVSPFLVVEVISESDPRKDLVRNRDLYWRVPSIQEYWIVDPRPEPAPSLLALVRGPGGWVERAVLPGGSYRTDLLPGLAVDLRAIFTRP